MNRSLSRFGKSLCISGAVLALVAIGASAQTKMSVGAGFDLMMPVGEFGDHWGTGFGGTGEFDYALSEHSCVTGKIGYMAWSGKNLPSGVTATYSGVPILAGLKYYPRFMPKDGVRGYGHLELGIFAGSVSVSGNNWPYTPPKGTGFTLVPSLGVEIPVVEKGKVDLSIRLFDISRRSSVGLRAGYVFVIK